MDRFIPTPFTDPADNAFVRLCGKDEENGGMGGCPDSLESMPLAMAYVPRQKWNTTYTLEEGLERGTIFPELDLPFTGMRGEMR